MSRVPSSESRVPSPESLRKLVAARVEESIAVKRCLVEQSGLLVEIALRVVAAYRKKRKVLLFGNGGSAADAQHLAAELAGKFRMKRPGLPAIALTTNTSILTAVGNDYSFDEVFSRQLEAQGQAGDVAIGISTSGTSPNVVAALRAARKKGLATVGFTGARGRKMRPLADYCLCVPSTDTARIQETHITAGHLICEIVEHAIFS
jgi:D-sedoheptulose 7-phosphate isomerase